MPKHWWEVPELKEAYNIRVAQLRYEMRQRFEKEFRVCDGAVLEPAYKEDAEARIRACQEGDIAYD